MSDAAGQAVDPTATLRSKRYVALLLFAAVVGVVVSLAAWGFLELVHQIQLGVFTDLPKDLGYDSAPRWWSLPVLAIAGVLVAFAIARLPGGGGHKPAHGLQMAPTAPVELPGVVLAGLASISLGVVIGPEAPLIALGGGLGALAAKLIRKDGAAEVGTVLAASGAFAALSLIFDSPLIAAVIMIEAAGLSGARLSLVLLPGMLAAGIGSLISIGMGSWTGLSTSAYALGALPLPHFARPDAADFGWTIALALAVAVGAVLIFRFAVVAERIVAPRPFLFLPIIGLAVSGLAIAFSYASDKSVNEVLFSGQDALPGLVSGAAAWSLSALALLIGFKALAWCVSLAGFRGGPTFPALFLGAAGGLMAARLPGFEATPAVAVALGAAVAAVLKLPLSAVVLAVVLTSSSGPGATPLVIVGVVVAYLATLAMSGRQTAPPASDGKPRTSVPTRFAPARGTPTSPAHRA